MRWPCLGLLVNSAIMVSVMAESYRFDRSIGLLPSWWEHLPGSFALGVVAAALSLIVTIPVSIREKTA